MKILLCWLPVVCIPVLGLAQPIPCEDPPTMTSTCLEACIICDIDGFSGRHESTIVGEAPPGFAGECTFVAHNMQWIAFIAGSEDLEVRMSVSNCRDGRGLEFGLYEGINCQNFRRISNCYGGAAGIVGPGQSGIIKNTEPLIIGQYYYIVMDGGLGDNCDWKFEVVSGDTRVAPLEESGPIGGDLRTCPAIENLYVVAEPVGATEFLWTLDSMELGINNDSILIEFDVDGVYELCVTSSNACDQAPPSCRTIVVRSIPTTVLREKICADETYEIDGVSLEVSGLYEFPLLNEMGCDSLVILELEVLEVPILNLDLNICEGDSLYLGKTPYFTTGIYQERLLTELNCDSIINLDLFVVICNIQASQITNSVRCNGEASGAILFQIDRGTPPFRYDWAKIDDPAIAGNGTIAAINEEQLIDALPAGTYLINIFDEFDNTSILIAQVPQPPPVSASFEAPDLNGFNVSCNGSADGKLSVQAGGGVGPYQLFWENGSTINERTNLPAGTYQITIADAVGCVGAFEYTLTEPVPIEFDIKAHDPGCEGPFTGRIQLDNLQGGASPYQYQITGFPLSALPSFEELGSGDYEVLVRDRNGCSTSRGVTLTASEIPEIVPIGDFTIRLGDSIFLEVQTNFIELSEIRWDTTYGLSCADCLTPIVRPLQSINYTVSVVSGDGCIDSESFSVFIDRTRRIYAPTAFSPNQDGANDFFIIFGGPDVEQLQKLSVFDRWGNLIYEQEQLDHQNGSNGWDGTYKGNPADNGVYAWIAEVRFIDGRTKIYSGSVTLVR